LKEREEIFNKVRQKEIEIGRYKKRKIRPQELKLPMGFIVATQQA